MVEQHEIDGPDPNVNKHSQKLRLVNIPLRPDNFTIESRYTESVSFVRMEFESETF